MQAKHMKVPFYRKRRVILLIVVLALAMACLVGATVAWLTSQAGPVVNTFSGSDLTITLAETTGVLDATTGERSFKMVPGIMIDKDPTITVEKDSEPWYLFVRVKESDALVNYIDWFYDKTNWELIGEEDATACGFAYKEYDKATDGEAEYIYLRYKDTALDSAITADTKISILTPETGSTTLNRVQVKKSVTKQMLTEAQLTATPVTLEFEAFAIQQLGFNGDWKAAAKASGMWTTLD